MSTVFYNKPDLKQYRRQLRNHLTPAEAGLWNYLKAERLKGRKFRRQYSIGNYILDFYCIQEKLAIELDGEVHHYDTTYHEDNKRDHFLEERGIRVLRFENKLVFEYLEEVLKIIVRHFKS